MSRATIMKVVVIVALVVVVAVGISMLRGKSATLPNSGDSSAS